MTHTSPEPTPPTSLHPVVTVRGQLSSWKPGDAAVALELAIELSGDQIGRTAMTYLDPRLVNPTNPALGLNGYVAEDAVRPHHLGSFKWSGMVPRNQALTLLVWSRMGHVRAVPLFLNVSVQDSFLLAERQVTLDFPA